MFRERESEMYRNVERFTTTGRPVRAEHVGIRARRGNRTRVFIDGAAAAPLRSAPHSVRFGDPLAVDNAYSLLTYIVIDARSRPRDLFSMHRNIRSTDFAPPAAPGEIPENRAARRGAKQYERGGYAVTSDRDKNPDVIGLPFITPSCFALPSSVRPSSLSNRTRLNKKDAID